MKNNISYRQEIYENECLGKWATHVHTMPMAHEAHEVSRVPGEDNQTVSLVFIILKNHARCCVSTQKVPNLLFQEHLQMNKRHVTWNLCMWPIYHISESCLIWEIEQWDLMEYPSVEPLGSTLLSMWAMWILHVNSLQYIFYQPCSGLLQGNTCIIDTEFQEKAYPFSFIKCGFITNALH